MAAKKKTATATATEGEGTGAAKAGRAAPIPPLEGVDGDVLKKAAAALRKVTPDKSYKATNVMTEVGPRRCAVAWHFAVHRAAPLFTLRSQLLDSFKLPPVSADTILDLLPRLRTELPSGPEVPRLPVLGETWRHDEDELLVSAYLLDKERVRARAAELPTPLALPFVAARFGEPISADEGRAILGLLGEAIGAQGSLLQLPWATDQKEYAWFPANDDDVAGYYELLRRTFGDTTELDRGVIRGVGKATFRVSADPYLGATSIATPKELQRLWPEVPDQHIPVLTERLLARGEPASFFFAAADAARARVKKGTDDSPTRYSPDAEDTFAAADFYLALAVLASGAREVPATTDGRWTLAEAQDTNPQRNRLLTRAFARLPRERALAVAERFLVEQNFFYARVMVILAAHFDAGLYERVLGRCAADGRAWSLVGLPGAAALPQLAAAHDRAAGQLKADLHRALTQVEPTQMAESEPPRKSTPSEERRTPMTIDYASRRRPEIFKPLVDAALSRIAAVGGRTFTPPAAVESGTGPWGYLDAAVSAGRADLTTAAVGNALGEHSWNHQFLAGKLGEHQTAFEAVETEEDAAGGGDDEEDFDGEGRPVVLTYYPEESHECLRQGNFVGGADADVIALWQRADRTSVCHAHMEGFWILGEDPVDFIERIAAKAEGKVA